MTLLQLRTILNGFIHNRGFGGAPADSYLNQIVNLALQHVGNWVASTDADYLLTEQQFTLANPTEERWIFVTPTAPYSKVKRIVEARVIEDVGVDDDPTLKVITFASARSEFEGAPSVKPPVFVYNEKIGVVNPKPATVIAVTYVHALPFLTTDTDEPSALPESIQLLVPTYAAILLLTGEASDSQQWQGVFAEQKAEVAATLGLRKITQERT